MHAEMRLSNVHPHQILIPIAHIFYEHTAAAMGIGKLARSVPKPGGPRDCERVV